MATLTLKVGGMTCGGCANSVRKAVAAVPGVQSVDVSLEAAQATVTYDDAKAQAAQLKSAIEDAGFETA